MNIKQRLEKARAKFNEVRSSDYLETLTGTIGADPLRPSLSKKAISKEEHRQVA